MKLLKQLLIEGIQEKSAEDFIKQIIKNSPFENRVFAVGGYVRDLVRGVDAKDLDLVIDYPNGGIEFANWITKKIGNYKEGSNPVTFPRFLTAQFNLNGILHNGVDLTGFKIESVAPRSEEYLDPTSRKPDVKQSDLRGDSLRRDLTINALYKNISTGEILDPTGEGLKDLQAKILKPPGNPDKIYEEDALRLLRIVRFYAKYKFDIPLNIIKSIKKNASRLENISAERIQEELNKMLLTSNPEKAIKLLKITDLLQYVIPELKQAIKMTQNKHHNERVFDHILSVLSKTKPNLVSRLGALLHDIGKIATRQVIDGEVHFYGHENVGAEMTEKILKRLKYPTNIIDTVVKAVKNHMRLKQAGKEGEKISDKTLRKFVVDMGEHLEDIMDIIDADNKSHAPGSEMPNQITNLIKRINILKSTIPQKNQKSPITGEDLKLLGFTPGPLFKELIELVKDKQLENPDTTKEEYIELVKNYVKNKYGTNETRI